MDKKKMLANYRMQLTYQACVGHVGHQVGWLARRWDGSVDLDP